MIARIYSEDKCNAAVFTVSSVIQDFIRSRGFLYRASLHNKCIWGTWQVRGTEGAKKCNYDMVARTVAHFQAFFPLAFIF